MSSEEKVIQLDEYRVKQEEAKGRIPLQLNSEFDDRIQRIKLSIEKIDRLMKELDNTKKRRDT
jgi:hypothetical protein